MAHRLYATGSFMLVSYHTFEAILRLWCLWASVLSSFNPCPGLRHHFAQEDI